MPIRKNASKKKRLFEKHKIGSCSTKLPYKMQTLGQHSAGVDGMDTTADI